MMRLALAATMFQAAAAVATCTVQSCCVDMVQGMCSGNTHDAAGKATGDVGVTSTEITAVSCTGATPENKGATQAGRDEVACCQAALRGHKALCPRRHQAYMCHRPGIHMPSRGHSTLTDRCIWSNRDPYGCHVNRS